MKTKKGEDARNEDEISYEQKSKQASTKLKNITSHMKDVKAIIDMYKIEQKHAKEKSWWFDIIWLL